MTTIEEYLGTPETVLPRELAFGVMRVADAPVVSHQRVVFLDADPIASGILTNLRLAPVDIFGYV